MTESNLTDVVREKYARAALGVVSGEGGCCSPATTRGG